MQDQVDAVVVDGVEGIVPLIQRDGDKRFVIDNLNRVATEDSHATRISCEG